MKGNDAMVRLVEAQAKMVQRMQPRSPVVDSGIIQDDYSLKLDSLQHKYPKGFYSVVRGNTFLPDSGLFRTQLTVVTGGPHGHPDAGSTASHDHTPHLHEVWN